MGAREYVPWLAVSGSEVVGDYPRPESPTAATRFGLAGVAIADRRHSAATPITIGGAAAATQCPEQLRVGLRGDPGSTTIGIDDVEGPDAVGRPTVFTAEPRQSATEGIADNADHRGAYGQPGQTVRGGRRMFTASCPSHWTEPDPGQGPGWPGRLPGRWVWASERPFRYGRRQSARGARRMGR